MNMKVSVVVPTHKRPLLLERCIDALRQQDFPPGEFEIIIVSDGADSETQNLIHSIKDQPGPSIRYISLPVKKGPAAARNLGWRNAQSSLIMFTDDDCIPDPAWISAMYSLYEMEGLDLIAFTGKTIVPISDPPTDYEKNIAHLSNAEFITANCALTMAALRKVDGLDEQYTMAWREDSDLQFRLIQQNIPILRNEQAIITHPVRAVPWGVCLKEERKGIFNALLYKKFPLLYREKIQSNPPWNYYMIVLAFCVFIAGVVLGWETLAIGGFAIWFAGTVKFISKRLTGVSRSWRHTTEMIFTSAAIPFLSLYYRIYGALKFRAKLFP
jgi:glycosyltransferase involved in cell wall biosynthesis